jgi:hypothetical protein
MSQSCRACKELLAIIVINLNAHGIPDTHAASLSYATNLMARLIWHFEPKSSEIVAWMMLNGHGPVREREEAAVALMVCSFVRSVKSVASKTVVHMSLAAATSEAARDWACQVQEDLAVEGELCGW